MFGFKVIKQSKKSRARLGLLQTSHGLVETPAFVPVATQATIKTLDSEQTLHTNSQLLICNTFHLHLRPGQTVVAKAGGLHKFMNWPKPLMTDSGGFQVFSLGFGKDLGVGKLLKFFPEQSEQQIGAGQQPKEIKITKQGVYFSSPLDGQKLFIGPKESIKIQQQLGADIIFAFDECTPPLVTKEYAKAAMLRTHRWAELCLQQFAKSKSKQQALYGIVQGSHFKELRLASAKFIASLPFAGLGIGGDLGRSKKDLHNILDWTVPGLPAAKPRHLLGVGYLEDMPNIIKAGVDTFDCIVPTHMARHGIAFTSKGRLNLKQAKFNGQYQALDKKCACATCQNYTRAYLHHLLRAKELSALALLTAHNLHFFNAYLTKLRLKIKQGKL